MNEQRDPETSRLTPEQVAGQLARLLRLGRGWSQQEVAERMRAYGYQWSQATVTRLEAATRPIRLNELADLAALFGVPPAQFLELGSPDFAWDDLDALQKEIGSLKANQAALQVRLDVAREESLAAGAKEAIISAEIARTTWRLEVLKQWVPQAAQHPKESREGSAGR